MDGFWMEVERIRQRDALREEDGSRGEGRPPEGKEPGGAAGRKGGARCRGTWARSRLGSEHGRAGSLGLLRHLHRSPCSTLAPCVVIRLCPS